MVEEYIEEPRQAFGKSLDFNAKEQKLFSLYIENHRPRVSRDAEDVAPRFSMSVEELQSIVSDWDELKDEPVEEETSEQLRDGYNVDATIFSTADYAEVHPAKAWGYWLRNKEGLGSFPREPLKTPLEHPAPGDEVRINILKYMDKDVSDHELVDAVVNQDYNGSTAPNPEQVQKVIDTYGEHSTKYEEKLSKGIIDGV